MKHDNQPLYVAGEGGYFCYRTPALANTNEGPYEELLLARIDPDVFR